MNSTILSNVRDSCNECSTGLSKDEMFWLKELKAVAILSCLVGWLVVGPCTNECGYNKKGGTETIRKQLFPTYKKNSNCNQTIPKKFKRAQKK